MVSDEDLHVAAVLTNLSQRIFLVNKEVGWYTDLQTGLPLNRNIMEMLMLIVTEVSEGAEGHRKNLADDHLPHRRMLEVELADAVIRILDLAAYQDLDIGGAIIEKLEYNARRADHKLENRKQDHGKIC